MEQGWLIICGVLSLVGLFNLGLALSVLRSVGRRKPFFEGSLSELLNPWNREQRDLDDLSRRVERLQPTQPHDAREEPRE